MATWAHAQLPDECFDETPVFGSTQNADYKSDLPFLQSSTFSNEFRISQINMCGQFQAFEGIQLFLQSEGTIMFLNQFGRATSCDNFVVPETQYIKQVQLAYNTMGVTYLKITTS